MPAKRESVKRAELVRWLADVPPFPRPDPRLEQVQTPTEVAADLLLGAYARGDLEGRSVIDLGAGTGVLALGAARLGAGPVRAVELDAGALSVARAAAERLGVSVTWLEADVGSVSGPADTVLMNPPFGAQRRHADRPFWEAAFSLARRRIYAFALADARTFIAGRAVARGARIEETVAVPWRLPRTFPHHRKRAQEIAVDRWVLTVGHRR